MEEYVMEIGYEAVADEVYALAALRYVSAGDAGDVRPALLTRGHGELLRAAVADQFAMLAAELIRLVDDVDTEGMRLTLRSGAVFPSGAVTALRRGLEHVLALRVMESALSGSDAARYASAAEAAMVSLCVMMAGSVPLRRQCHL